MEQLLYELNNKVVDLYIRKYGANRFRELLNT